MGYQSRIAEDEYLKQERLLQILLKSQELESLKEKYKIEVLQKVTSLEDAKKKVEKKLKEQQALYENVLADRKVLETAVAHSESEKARLSRDVAAARDLGANGDKNPKPDFYQGR